MNAVEIAKATARYEAQKDRARKNGIARICAGYYLVANANDEIFEVERGSFREYEGADAKMWFVSQDGDVVGEYMTLKEAKAAVQTIEDEPTPVSTNKSSFTVRVNYADNFLYEKGQEFNSIEEFNIDARIRSARIETNDMIKVSVDILNNDGDSIYGSSITLTEDTTDFCLISRIKSYRAGLAKIDWISSDRLFEIDTVISWLEDDSASQ